MNTLKADLCTYTGVKTVECKVEPLEWQKQGLSYTASGYGSRIPTQYMVRFNNRWRRVYCYIYSNIGTLYIGARSIGLHVHILD